MNEQAPLVDRVNVEPPIINGMSQSEALFTGGVSLFVFFLLGLMLAMFTKVWWVLLVFSAIGPVASVWLLSGYLAALKRNRPDGYYLHWIRLRMLKLGVKCPFIRHDGFWQIGRGFDRDF
jgi:conjugative transfer region protein (TIGR03750 family)